MNNKKIGFLVAGIFWLLICGVVAISYRFIFKPQADKTLIESTDSSTNYKETIKVGSDSFSGYAIFRSSYFRNEMKANGIKIVVEDDGGNYDSRIESLKNGETQFAVFTIDSFIKSSAKIGSFPATIILVIDESNGADAVVGNSQVHSIEDLNKNSATFILAPNSPSEHLARVIKASFMLPNLPQDWIVEANGVSDAFDKFKAADKTKPTAVVLWEPYVSKALTQKGAHLLIDSSKIRGQIIDVLVVNREYLSNNRKTVKLFTESYFRSNYYYAQNKETLTNLISEDSRLFQTEITDEQAEKLASTIRFRNTIENYVLFGLISGREAKGLESLEDSISRIASVLVKTGSLIDNPVLGKESTIYYDSIMKEMRNSQFHPASVVEVEGAPRGAMEKVSGNDDLPALNEEQWDSLASVGKINIQSISFGRGKSNISMQSQRDLDELVKTLISFPRYYIRVIGSARNEGDMTANLELAKARAEAVYEYLQKNGVDKKRMMSSNSVSSSSSGEDQSVAFIVGELPY